jgi:putative restriction endonuclease
VKAFVAVTDGDWFEFLSNKPDLDEVNFWQPGGTSTFKRLDVGEPLLFKLHAPDNRIVGGGYFRAFSQLPISLAWEAFGEKNGVASLEEMRERTAKYRRIRPNPQEDYTIGCVILQDPFFFGREDQFPQPSDYKKHSVQGMSYELSGGIGKQLWDDVLLRLQGSARHALSLSSQPMYGEPTLTRHRLGQGAFRVLITDLYKRRCAISDEKILPVLEAAHIWPVKHGGEHRLDNGLLLRSDLHKLFDKGYLTVTSNHEVLVSRRLRADFHNGEYYQRFSGKKIDLPTHVDDRSRRGFLEKHAEVVFLR